MRIVQVHSSDFGGGAETVVRSHHEELLRIGHQSRLLVGRKRGAETNTLAIPFRKGPKGLLRLSRFIERKWGLQGLYSPSFRNLDSLVDFVPEIFHVHSLHGADGYADIRGLTLLSRQFKTFLTLHDLWLMTGHCGHPLACNRWRTGCGNCPDLTLFPPINRDSTRLNFKLRQLFLRGSRLNIIVPSRWLAEQVRNSPILGHFPVSVVPNPVNTQIFTPNDRRNARSVVGIDNDSKTILLIAQHLANPYKGIVDAFDALNSLENLPKKFTVLLAGVDAEKALPNLKVPCKILPYSTDSNRIADYYRAADLLLMPSRGETFGLVAAEAMACGTPVISTMVGGLIDVVGDLFPELAIVAGDVNSIRNGILVGLNASEDVWQSWSAASSARIHRLFSQRQHTEHCLSTYMSQSHEVSS